MSDEHPLISQTLHNLPRELLNEMPYIILNEKNGFMNVLFLIKLEKQYHLSPAIKAKLYLALRKKYLPQLEYNLENKIK